MKADFDIPNRLIILRWHLDAYMVYLADMNIREIESHRFKATPRANDIQLEPAYFIMPQKWIDAEKRADEMGLFH